VTKPWQRAIIALALIFGGIGVTEALSPPVGVAMVLAGLGVIYLTGIAPGGPAWKKRHR
jgi:hypothetical protein